MSAIGQKHRHLPVAAIADEVNASLCRVPRLVVTAAPGAGKSTLLPLTILEGMPQGKILMLEPRRLAARQVALRMADMLGESVGETVGYRVRFETRVSDATRIEVLTEGIMEHALVDDPTLDGVSAVIFDEFHERSLSSDIALALTLEAQRLVRPDLRIIIMSATIDPEAICRSIDAPAISCDSRLHHVDIIHGEDYPMHECAQAVATAVRRALREQQGDILAFLPGQGEITRCATLLEGLSGAPAILPLYGMLPPHEQQRVLRPDSSGRRRVILSTPVAETSLTIEGISAVVDSGLCRMPVFNAGTGLTFLTTVPVSLDMAVQRSGRAARLSDGVCYRLWSKATELRLKESRDPEILSADLTQMVLRVAAWGENDPLRLPWISAPSPGMVARARKLLQALGAVDAGGVITPHGRRLAALPCHPRIGNMLLHAFGGKLPALAADIAALLEDKDPLNDPADADICTRIALLRQYRKSRCPGSWRRIADVASQYRRLIDCRADDGEFKPEDVGMLLADAYPERVALRCADSRYRLASGDYVTLDASDALSASPLLSVATCTSRILLAAPLSSEDAAAMASWVNNVSWDSRGGCAVARRELRLGTLVLATTSAEGDIRQAVTDVICAAAAKDGMSMFDFNADVRRLQLRIATLADWHPELNLPDVSTEALLADASAWLPMYIGKATSCHELRKTDMCAVITGMLDYEQQQALDRLAPTHITLPCGRRARIDYRRGAEAPIVSARLQDCFGLLQTPRIDDGRRTVLIELLSPGFKQVQLTQDIEGFWRSTYFEVRKELRRRYPKHAWPDNPAEYIPQMSKRRD